MNRPKTTSDSFRWLYIGTALFHLWAVARPDPFFIQISKPLLLTFLSLYFFLATRPNGGRFEYLLLAGLIFSIGGDTLLMFSPGTEQPLFFTLGLGCFLVTHLFYILAFLSWERRGLIYRRPWLAMPFFVYLLAMGFFLWPDLPDGLRLPVLIYSGVITTMAVSCLNLKDALPAPLFRSLIAGVLLFLISDSLIALNLFKAGQVVLPYPGLLIMVTYLLGQYLIAVSAVKMSERRAA